MRRGSESAGERAVVEFACSRLEIGEGNFSGIDFFKERFLGGVIFVRDAGAALEHPPGFAAFDGEEDHLA